MYNTNVVSMEVSRPLPFLPLVRFAFPLVFACYLNFAYCCTSVREQIHDDDDDDNNDDRTIAHSSVYRFDTHVECLVRQCKS